MYEVNVPGIGFSKFSPNDVWALIGGLLFIVWGILGTGIREQFGLMVGLSFLQVLCGVGLISITILHARRRVKWEEWVNPITQMEALRRHAMFEGVE